MASHRLNLVNSSVNHRLSAFSLLEMAVVITIIGLLLGGVTAAQSYIKNAQLSSMITEAKYYINAFGQFQTAYKAVPGDMATATESWATAGNGDGNGVISANGTAAPDTTEIFKAFQHLSFAGFIEGSYNGTGPNAVAGVNIPRSAFQGAGLIFDHPDALDGNVLNTDTFYYGGLYFHVMRIAAMSAAGLPHKPFLTTLQALEIDTKFDDGKPGTGWIMTPVPATLNCATTNVASSAAYQVNATGPACYLILRMQ